MTSSAMFACFVAILTVAPVIQPDSIELRQVLVLDPVGTGGRVPVSTNALVAKLVAGDFVAPVEGSTIEGPDGRPRTWTKAEAGEDGAINNRAFRGGFAFAEILSETERPMMLEAIGHSYVYVNDEPRAGDPYSFGFSRIPILLKKGLNTFLFSVGRGSLRAKLVAPTGELFLEARDATLPDLIIGEGGQLWGSVVLTNASTKVWKDMILTTVMDDGEPLSLPIGDIQPMSTEKIPFRFLPTKDQRPGQKRLNLRLTPRDEREGTISTLGFDLDVKPLTELHKRTFVSEVDGSVQYYAVRPPFAANIATADALILTVHGAGVEATGQAAAYGAKSWAWIVAPTNRRPYGFDWEDWGRIDALEALADAKAHYGPREDRIYLTGHSMGGHGAWFLGATYPDQWGAIGPCAGWISFWTYGGAVRFDDPDPIEAMLLRVSNPSNTVLLLRNYLQHGVYILHGDADNTVPLQQPRQMREYLAPFHRDLDWHEEPGGGHWYDNSPEPGADCVDYGPMMEFFDRHRRRLSKDVRRVEFVTTSPQVSASSQWITVLQQKKQFEPSSLVAINPIGAQRFELTLENIALVGIHIAESPVPDKSAPVDLKINDIEIKGVSQTDGWLYLKENNGSWQVVEQPSTAEKFPSRGGPFKLAFNNKFLLVYGTKGTPMENAWSYAKARYDAETWAYRGNGYAEIVPDTALTASGAVRRATNIIAYGNEDTNSVAAALLADSPVRVKRGMISADGKTLQGDDLSILMVRPKGGSNAQFAIVGGTGLKGMKSTDLVPYFVSGVHFPDVYVFDSRIHLIGTKAIRLTGVFGNDWSFEHGEMVWRE